MCEYSEKTDRSSQFDVVREENNTLVIVGTSSLWPHCCKAIDFMRFMAPSLKYLHYHVTACWATMGKGWCV